MKNKLILLMTLLLVAGIATQTFAEDPRNRLKQGSYIKNRRRLGEILVDYRLVRAVTIYAYPDQSLGFFIEAGRNAFLDSQFAEMFLGVIESSLKLIENETYDLELDTDPAIFIENDVRGSVNTIRVYSSTKIFSQGYTTIEFNGQKVEFTAEELREVTAVLQKREQVTQEMTDQMQDFQYKDDLQERIDNLMRESATEEV